MGELRKPCAPAGCRNGHGRPHRLLIGGDTNSVHRLDRRVERRIPPLSVCLTAQLGNRISELHLHGPAKSGFQLALRGPLGQRAPLRTALEGGGDSYGSSNSDASSRLAGVTWNCAETYLLACLIVLVPLC